MYTYLLPHIRRTIIQDSNRSADKCAALINVETYANTITFKNLKKSLNINYN